MVEVGGTRTYNNQNATFGGMHPPTNMTLGIGLPTVSY